MLNSDTKEKSVQEKMRRKDALTHRFSKSPSIILNAARKLMLNGFDQYGALKALETLYGSYTDTDREAALIIVYKMN